jgi:membrane protein
VKLPRIPGTTDRPGTLRGWWDYAWNRRPGAVRLLQDATVEAQRSRLPQMAAALSYRTIFGLIPVMVVALIALKSFTTDADLAEAINEAMQYSGLSQIAVSDSPANMGPFPETAAPVAQDTQSVQRLDQWIKDLVKRVSDVNLKLIGWIGLVAMLYAALSMLVEVERAFNQVYCVPVGRSWMRRFVNYWALLTLGTAALFTTFYVGQRFTSGVAEWAGGDGKGKILLAAIGYLSTVSISTLLMLLIYMVIPNAKVKVGPAMTGAFVGALAWEAGKWGFTQYLRFSTGYVSLYGSIALIPLFLLWVYFTWCVVLFGLNIAYYLQHGRRKSAAQPREQVNPAVVDPGSAISLAAALAAAFEKGRPPDAQSLAQAVNLQRGIVEQMLDRLVAQGVAVRAMRGEDNGYFTLARPADTISAEDVLRVGEDLIAQPAEGPIAQTLRDARRSAVQGRTIADFAPRLRPDGPAVPVSA